MYDYLIVGAGLFGCVFAAEAVRRGKSCLVLEKRGHIAGNAYTSMEAGIQVHRYGAHIFHTDSRCVWDYVNRYAEFNRYVHSPVAVFEGEVYNLPFNMNTFSRMWNIRTPQQAQAIIESQRGAAGNAEPVNLEEQAVRMVGRDIYEKLVRGYTEKQWGMRADQLPPSVIRRLPLRFTYDNNYFSDRFQGIPIGGYTEMCARMLEGAQLRLNTDFLSDRDGFEAMAKRTVYTGPVDAYFGYACGELGYRSLRFETEVLRGVENYQGCAVVNYTDRETPYTRIIEHKHFEHGGQPDTVITREYPQAWSRGADPYYPLGGEENAALYERYREMAARREHLILGGRLAEYRYYDMDDVILRALEAADAEFA